MMRKVLRVYAAILIAMMILSISAPSQAALFKIGESRELSMGRDAAEQIESRYPVSKDPRINDLVNDIGFRLARVSERPNLPWKFKVLDVNDINALSVPGYVYINRGLIDFTKGDQDQLASVIAHEVAHTTGRHAVRQAEKEMTYGLIVGLVLKGGTAQLGSLAANLAMLGYSRKDEHDADKRAVHLMARAGYDPRGMTEFLQNLNAKEKDDPNRFETYFRTHPAIPDRIVRTQNEANAIASGTVKP